MQSMTVIRAVSSPDKYKNLSDIRMLLHRLLLPVKYNWTSIP